jgi:hypothetical protein
VRVSQVSPYAQDMELRNRMAQVLRERGGREISMPYLPEYAKQRLSPEQLEEAEKAQRIISELGKKSRQEQKRRREAKQLQEALEREDKAGQKPK